MPDLIAAAVAFWNSPAGKALQIYLAYRAYKAATTKLPAPPGVDSQRVYFQRPYPPRVIGYGDFWTTPSCVHAYNSRDHYEDQAPDNRSSGPRGAVLLYAVADHEVECYEFHVGGEQFLNTNDQNQLLKRDSLIALNTDLGLLRFGHMPDPYIFPGTDIKVVGHGKDMGRIREDANKHARDALLDSHRSYQSPLLIVSGLRGNTAIDPNSNDFLYDDACPPFDQRSFGDLCSRIYARARKDDTTTFVPGRQGGGALDPVYTGGRHRAYWYHRGTPSVPDYDAQNMHFYGTAMMEITVPNRWKIDKTPIWTDRPQILMGCRRPRDTLRLWDDTVAGNPPIKAEWTLDNAALCMYDYLHRYTPFGVPVCGYSRMDLTSFAVAADVCHRRGYNVNGTINLEQSPAEVVRQFEYAMGGGAWCIDGGVGFIYAGEYTMPVLGYNEDEMVEDSWTLRNSAPRPQRPGLIDVVYVDDHGERQAVMVRHPLARENLENSQVEAVFINNQEQAKRLAFVLNHRAWDATFVSFKLIPDVPAPNVNDIITLDLDRLQWSGIYRVESVELLPDGTVKVDAASERPDLYTAPVENVEYLPPARIPHRGVGDDDPSVDHLLAGQGNANPGYILTRDGHRIRLRGADGTVRGA